jgi:uncharacterized membrane protein
MRTRTFRSLVSLGGAIGLIASIYAALEVYYASLTAVCSVNKYVSCGAVASSGKTSTLGIPDAAWGIAGFVLILALAVLAERRRRDARVAYVLLLVTTAGVALAFYFLYVEVVVIGALCPVCVSAYLCGGVAWVGAIGLARRGYRREHAPPEPADSGASPDVANERGSRSR